MADKANMLSTSEAAEFLRVHVETIRRMARKNELPTYRVGRQWRIPKDALIEWAEAHHPNQRVPLVLVVDDEKSIRQTTRLFLESENCEVKTAATGEEALGMARKRMPDLVLLDLVMPGISGVDVLKELHLMDPDLPVVVVTGYPDSKLMTEALRFPPVTLLPKPLDKATLTRTVRRVLQGTSRKA